MLNIKYFTKKPSYQQFQHSVFSFDLNEKPFTHEDLNSIYNKCTK